MRLVLAKIGVIDVNIVLELVAQARVLRKFLAIVFLLALLALSAAIIASATMGTPIGNLLSDPASILNVSPFTGAISNVGVLLWCATVSVCLFTWSVLRQRPGATQFSRFIFWSGLISLLLLVDDLFLLHEWVYPRHLGVTEQMTFSAYLVLISGWLLLFRKTILDTEYLVLLIAFGFFVLSLFVDTYDQIDSLIVNWRQLYEDGFKLLGIAGWCAYFFRCCFVEMSRTACQSAPLATLGLSRPESPSSPPNASAAARP